MAVPAREMLGALLSETLEAMIEERLAPLRLELARLRSGATPGPVTVDEAATRLGITPRDVRRRLKDGRLTAEFVGGVRMVRWPPPPSVR
jgi:excisionase family DNA binding protein